MTTRNIGHTLRIYRPRFIPTPDGPRYIIDQGPPFDPSWQYRLPKEYQT